MPRFDWWICIVLAIPGLFLFGMNWAIFFHNLKGKKWVSGIPPAGGVWIAVTALLSPCRWLALIGLADPGVWLFVQALISELSAHPTESTEPEDSGRET